MAPASLKLLLAACSLSAASAQPENFQGDLLCDNRVTGTTAETPGTNSIGRGDSGGAGFDHYWSFTLAEETTVTFDGCGSFYDSVIIVFRRGTNIAYSSGDARLFGADGGCEASGSRVIRVLDVGNYSVVMDGYDTDSNGAYEMAMACQPTATTPPSLAPASSKPSEAPTQAPASSAPTPAPTQAPTPVTSAPTPASTTAGPPTPPEPIPGRCPDGYDEYLYRYGWGLGQITIVTAHQDCADRCTQFSLPTFGGGCKGYMTGMYYGMLYCRSYGGNRFETTCAPWAAAEHAGIGSGALGSTHARTGQRNVGGSCCTNNTWLLGSGPTPSPTSATTVVSASSASSDDKAAGADIAITLGVTLGAVGALYAVYRLGHRRGGADISRE